MLLSSSYGGWGTASLAGDAAELEGLLCHLVEARGARRIALLGHSTGCQDVVALLRCCGRRARAAVCAVALQAPVSDREYLATLPDTEERLAAAQRLVDAGRGEELLPRHSAFGATPVTAARFVSLAARAGAEDFFSSDLSDAELADALGHVDVPTTLLPSTEDEYVPRAVDAAALAARLAAAMPRAEVCAIQGAPHAPAETQHVEALIAGVLALLERANAASSA